MAEPGKRSEKRKERREARLRDITMDDGGRYSYTGDLWKIADSETAGSAAKQRVILMAMTVVLAMIVIGSGCIDARNAMGSFYVVLPYIGEVSALFALLWNAAKVLVPSEGVRTYALEHSKPRVIGACRILMVFALAGLLFSAIYLFRHGAGGKTADGIAYLLLKAAAAVLSEWYGRRFAATAWEAQ